MSEIESKKAVDIGADLHQIEKIAMDINNLSNQSLNMNQTFKEQFSKVCNSFDKIESEISALYEKSKSIGKTVDSITKITTQTNLLAVNAAIESARAGEYGRTFSVIADEINNLALETSSLASNINHVIKDIQIQINGTKELLDKEANSFGQLDFEDHDIGNDLDRIGNKLIEALDVYTDSIQKTFRFDNAKAKPESYYDSFLNQLISLSEKTIKRDSIIFGIYFETDPRLLAHLSKEDQSIGIYTFRQDHKVVSVRNLFIKDFFASNPYMAWYYNAIKAKQGVWSKVYYDRYSSKELVSYSCPVFVSDQFLGVAGADIDYSSIKISHQDNLLQDMHTVVAQINAKIASFY